MPNLTPLQNWLWQTTWQAALLAVVVALITWIFGRRLSAQARQMLWMLVFIRLVLPVLPGSPMSIFNLFPHESPPQSVRTIVQIPAGAIWSGPREGAIQIPAHIRSSEFTLVDGLLAIWLLGATAILTRIVLLTMRFSRNIRRTGAEPDATTLSIIDAACREAGVRPPTVYLTDLVSTPSLFGAFRPCLLLPASTLTQLDSAGLRSVVLHELEHLNRRHLLADWILTVIRSVHWFNPAAWWAHRQIRAARELICDQAVLARLDEVNSRGYGLAMLTLATGVGRQSSGVPIAAFAQDQNLLRQRIEAIASGKRKYIVGLGLVLIAIVAAVFMTRAQDNVARAQDNAAPPVNKTLRYPDNWPTTGPTTAPTNGGSEDLNALLQKADDLRMQQKYDQALPIVRHVLELDPTNEWAAVLLPQIENRVAVSRRGARGGGRAQPVTPTAAALEKVVPELKFDGVPFSDVIDFLRDISNANIYVNWRALEQAGIDENTPVTARLREVKFSRALDTILRDVSGGTVKIVYTTDDNIINISTEQELAANHKISVAPATKPADPAVLALLDRNLPEMKLDGIAFSDVIDFIRDVTQANIVVDWRALQAAGILRTSPVTLRVRDVTLAKTLESILRDVGGGNVPLGYTVDGNVITISTVAASPTTLPR